MIILPLAMRSLKWILGVIVLLWGVHAHAAAPLELTLRHKHHLFAIRPAQYPAWFQAEERFFYRGMPFTAPQEIRVEGDALLSLPPGVTRTTVPGWNRHVIASTIQSAIAPKLDRPPGRVTISRNGQGNIVFEGVGLPGRALDVSVASALIVAALDKGIADVTLPVAETQPTIDVLDAELSQKGIREVIAVGESNFAGSHLPRRHNIATGMARFHGHLIERGEEFSFASVLGPVNAETGYQKELVILGERTLPDYGGGLCQVSTTAYRGVWEYGLPILKRKNHSFAVRYYGPQGTDATVYPPNVDLRFYNDTPGALLIQTYAHGDDAYFIYYGTHDDRRSSVFGPFTWNQKQPPDDRTEYTTEIPVGTTRKVGDPVPGMDAAWFRILSTPTATGSLESIQSTYSAYEARPLFTQIGVGADSSLLGTTTTSVSSISSVSSRSSRRTSSARHSLRPSRRRR